MDKILNTPTPAELIEVVNDIIDNKLDKTSKASSATISDSATSAVSANTAEKLSKNVGLSITGDASSNSVVFDGSTNINIPITLTSTGITAGTYGQASATTLGNGDSFSIPYITVDAKGRITAISNKSTKLPTINSDLINELISYTASTQGKRILAVTSATPLDSSSNTGSGDITKTTYNLQTNTGLPAGSTSLRNLLQSLVNLSHTHTTQRTTVKFNCDCHCGDSDGD